MKYIYLTLLIFLISCDQEQISTHYVTKPKQRLFVVNGEVYKVYKGSDNHDYYLLEISMGGQLSSLMPFHYPDCEKCK